MPVLMGLFGIAVAGYVIFLRARRGAAVASDLVDMAGDARAAARRFGFKRHADVHPVNSIEDPRLAVAALAVAFSELEDLPTQETRAALDLHLRKHLKANAAEAQEMVVLGHWLASQCGGPVPAISRLARHLFALDSGASFALLMAIIQGIVQATDRPLSPHQTEALVDIKRAFRLS